MKFTGVVVESAKLTICPNLVHQNEYVCCQEAAATQQHSGNYLCLVYYRFQIIMKSGLECNACSFVISNTITQDFCIQIQLRIWTKPWSNVGSIRQYIVSNLDSLS